MYYTPAASKQPDKALMEIGLHEIQLPSVAKLQKLKKKKKKKKGFNRKQIHLRLCPHRPRTVAEELLINKEIVERTVRAEALKKQRKAAARKFICQCGAEFADKKGIPALRHKVSCAEFRVSA